MKDMLNVRAVHLDRTRVVDIGVDWFAVAPWPEGLRPGRGRQQVDPTKSLKNDVQFLEEKFHDTVALSFVCGNYCLTMN